jgi:hypothetical protein
LLIRHHAQLDIDRRHPRHPEYRSGDVAVERVTEGTASDGQQDPDVYPTSDVHLYPVDHAEIGNGPANLRIVHPMQCRADLGHPGIFNGGRCGVSVGLRVVHATSVGEFGYAPDLSTQAAYLTLSAGHFWSLLHGRDEVQTSTHHLSSRLIPSSLLTHLHTPSRIFNINK